MALISAQSVSHDGLDPTFEAAANDDSFKNTGSEYFHVKNGSAASITVTIDSVKLCNYGFDHNLSVDVPASGEKLIGPFSVARFGSTIEPTYSDVTSVTVAVVKV